MAAVTGTLAVGTEFAGAYKLVSITGTMTTATDAITLTAATHGISEITAVVSAVITGGLDAAFSYLQVSATGLVISLAAFEQDGSAATDFTGTTVAVTVIGTV